MNPLARALGRQLRHPRGLAGRLLARGMASANRSVVAQTVRAADIRPDSRVLDLGCGSGEALTLLGAAAPRGAVAGMDHSALMVERARRTNPGADVRQARFTALPYPDASFDRIVAINVAYFWDDAPRVRAELLRVAAPGGRIAVYLTAPVHLERIGLARSGTHRLWTADEMMQLLGPAARRSDIRAARTVGGHIILLDVDDT